MFVDFNILNQLGSPSINSNTFANRPAAGQTGRLFVSTDTFEIYRDNGTTWDLIGGPGSSTITGTGQATEVAFFTSSQAISSSANLFWDNTNQYLGIGTSVPNAGVNVQDVDALGVLSNITTVVGTSTSSVSVWGKNTTNSSGYAGIFEEITPNSSSGQYPVLIRHTLSSGTAAANMATGIHFGLPDNAGTERINQFSMDTVDAAAATYSSRYRFLLRSNGAAVTPFYITGTGLGVFTATPGAALDIHSTGTIAQLNSTGTTNNGYLAFQRTGATTFSIGDTYNGGSNYFRIFGSALSADIVRIFAATGESSFTSTETYSSGNSIGVAVQHNLTIPNGVNVGLAALGGVNSNLNLSLGGSTTVANTGRQGLEGSTTIGFTGAGTLTMTQGSTVRAFSALSSVYAFNGSAVGTITHLAGLRICFPDNVGSAVNITNNYALLINNQTTGTGTVTYTNRWGIYQEGSSDLNYFAGNSLFGTTTNVGAKIAISGYMYISNRPLAQIVFNSTGTYYGQIQNDAADKWSFARNASNDGSLGTPIMTWQATNIRVGINTDSPNSIFEVKNTGTGTKSIAAAFRDSSADGNGIEIYNENGLSSIYSTYYTGAGSNQDLGFYTTTSAGAQNQVMRLTSTQRVGIGTGAPTREMVLYRSTGEVHFKLANGTTGQGTTDGFDIAIDGGGGAYLINRENQPIYFFTNGSENARITAGGNFLIGTTTDAGQKLQVNGSVKATEYLTSSGNVSNPFGTWTTMFTVSGGVVYEMYQLIVVYLYGGLSYTSIATVVVNNGSAALYNYVNGGALGLRVNGLDVQCNNGSGSTLTIEYKYIKI